MPSKPLPALRLTQREKDVLRLLATGRTTREVARELFLTHNTVREYVARLYAKLGVHKRSELIARAVELGFLSFHFRI